MDHEEAVRLQSGRERFAQMQGVRSSRKKQDAGGDLGGLDFFLLLICGLS
jgi:hypothetical protein